jgi:hypothetical protein
MPWLILKARLNRQKRWTLVPRLPWAACVAGLVLKWHWQNIGQLNDSMMVALKDQSGLVGLRVVPQRFAKRQRRAETSPCGACTTILSVGRQVGDG